MNLKAIEKKLLRFRSGGSLRVLDLFSGCGGLSLGFRAAGFTISAAVEADADAARSHGINFHPGKPSHCVSRDITKTTPRDLATELDLGAPALAIDVIVGGPPCQAFARVGRSKLREVAEHPEAYRHDKRSRLYIDYLDYVEAFAPLAVVMENVPDMLNHGGHNIAAEVCEVLEGKGYVAAYSLLNAAFYGVPQMRERMFLIAVRKELLDEVSFPEGTNWIELPSGYEGSRAVALKLLRKGDPDKPEKHYRSPPQPDASLPAAVSVREAIGDLPTIDARALLAAGSLKRGTRRFNVPQLLGNQHISQYAKLMREWPGYESRGTVLDHVIRYLPRDYELFSRMQAGDQYPAAHKLALMMFEEELVRIERAEGVRPKNGSALWNRVKDSIVPPYDPGKFPNKWRKMEADRPSRTLMAHLGKDSYSHIHYDDAQARTISVREAARLQSFPDGFQFCGTMNPAFRQIGNAVPPLLAKAVAVSLLDQMRQACSKPTLRAAGGY